MAIIHVKNVSHSFGKENVLDNVNLLIQEGEIFGLLGPSGAGKTTLVKLIVGILEATQGEIVISGKAVPSLELLTDIGYMAQADALYSELSAKENLQFFAQIYRLKKQMQRERIDNVLKVVGLSDHANKTINQFSGGMKRRLSLSIALLHQPKLLILDEPTVGIDPVLRQSIWSELRKLKEDGMTIIVTTHVMDEAEKCDRLAMLRDGRIIACDTPERLKEKLRVSSLEDVFLAYGGGNL